MISFWDKNSIAPSVDSFKTWCQNTDAIEQLVSIGRGRKPKRNQHQVYVKVLREGIIARGMLEMAEVLADDVGRIAHTDMLNSALSKLTDLTGFTSDKAMTTRGEYWERAPDRWERFKKYADNPDLRTGIPFGIKEIDTATGGLHSMEGEADVVGIFAKPGAYKSRLLLNMAYNQVRAGVPVMFISREMAAERIEILLDSRESLEYNPSFPLDYSLIQEAYLNGRYRKAYRGMLQNLFKKLKYPLWLVDSPNAMSSADIIRELEIYKTAKGFYPQVLYIDYANLIDPIGEYGGQDYQKLDRVFVELLGIGKGYRIPIVTPLRESRTGSLKKERDDVGIEHVGLSQAVAYHLHLLIHLDNTAADNKSGVLWARCKKNRYGPLFQVQLEVLPEYSYVGDWRTQKPEDEDGFGDL